MNQLMCRKGRVIDDRYHVHALKTPTEVGHALRYLRLNAHHHGLTTRAHLKNDAVARSRRAEGAPYAAEPNRGTRPQRRGRRTCGTSTEVARTDAARRPAAATAAGGIYEMCSSRLPDPYSSWVHQDLIAEPHSWLLRVGHRRAGP